MPAFSRLLQLRPLHASDWLLVGLAFLVTGMLTLGLAARLKQSAG